jgi:hypothetical protein
LISLYCERVFDDLFRVFQLIVGYKCDSTRRVYTFYTECYIVTLAMDTALIVAGKGSEVPKIVLSWYNPEKHKLYAGYGPLYARGHSDRGIRGIGPRTTFAKMRTQDSPLSCVQGSDATNTQAKYKTIRKALSDTVRRAQERSLRRAQAKYERRAQM